MGTLKEELIKLSKETGLFLETFNTPEEEKEETKQEVKNGD